MALLLNSWAVARYPKHCDENGFREFGLQLHRSSLYLRPLQQHTTCIFSKKYPTKNFTHSLILSFQETKLHKK